ncbi:MAG TPA: hypothetical protein VFT12_01670 [Thermoanaerobaculia bacterium]|nr:hypothetical protein [Thermoanaerobaculia bacterium]
MTNIKIALLLMVVALAGWRPLQEQKTAVTRTVAAMVMNSVLCAQSAVALEQSNFRNVDAVAARPTPVPSRQPEQARRLAVVKAKSEEECTCTRPPARTHRAEHLSDMPVSDMPVSDKPVSDMPVTISFGS